MKLRAQITVDIEVPDFIAAAEHQKRFEEIFTEVKGQYQGAVLELRERRSPTAPRSSAGEPPPVRRETGRLHAYGDY